MKFVQKTDSCWFWTGAKNKFNYGYFFVNRNKRCQRAHRVSFEIFNGIIPDGLIICHTCDNRLCVNPKHLFIGTHRDNTQDMISKKRNRPVRGQSNHNSKLTEDHVVKIKEEYKTTKVTQYELSKKYGVGQHQISRIINGKRWAHIL